MRAHGSTVGILYAGEMGAALGRALAADGLRIVTTLECRGPRTQRLCREAGLEELPDLTHPPMGQPILLAGAADPGAPFVPLIDGQDATLVEGAQGGFHVWLRYRVQPAHAEHVLIVRGAHRQHDGKVVLRIPPADLDVGTPDAQGGWEPPMASPMFMCPSPIGISVVDVPIVFEVTLTDSAGQTLSHGQVTLVPRCPVANFDFCRKICTG